MTSNNDRDKKGFAGLSSLASGVGGIDELIKSEQRKEAKPAGPKSNLTTQQESILEEVYEQYPASNNIQLMAYFGIKNKSGKYEYEGRTFYNLEEAIVLAYSRQKKADSQNHHIESERQTTRSPQPIKMVSSVKSGGSTGNWFLGIIGVLFVIWFVYNGGQSNKSPSYNPPSSSRNYGYPKSNSAPAGRPPSPAQNTGLQYTKPSVGTNNVLSVPQIRWCIREGIRIEAMRDVIDSNAEVGKFNQIVDDYNSRCGSYRYRQGSQARAKSDVEPHRNQIVAEARQLGRSYQPSYPSVSSGTSTSSAPKKPSAQYTREAQQLLTDLGYNPGPIDGDYGRQTAAAVKKFQRDAGTTQGGWIDEDLLFILRQAAYQRSKTNPKKDEFHSVRETKQYPGVPENGYVSGNYWFCNDGYRKEQNRCVKVVAPENGYVAGAYWFCNDGYRKEGNSCVSTYRQ